MSTEQKPPPGGGGTPRVHHTGTQGGTPAVPSGTPEEQFTAQDYNNPAINDYLPGEPVKSVVYDGDQPKAAPQEPPPGQNPPILFSQAVQNASDKVKDSLNNNKPTFWRDWIGEARLRFVPDGIDPSLVRIPLTYNSTQACDGGLAMLKTVQSVGKKADVMGVDPQALGKKMARVLRIHSAIEQVGWLHEILQANLSHALADVADDVDRGLKNGASVIAADGNMTVMLRPAQAIRKGPAQVAQATKASNARMQADAMAAAQAKLQAEAKAAAPTPPVSPEIDKTKK